MPHFQNEAPGTNGSVEPLRKQQKHRSCTAVQKPLVQKPLVQKPLIFGAQPLATSINLALRHRRRFAFSAPTAPHLQGGLLC